jgi:hypothetical protein
MPPVEIHLKNAKAAEIDKEIGELREMYELYRVARKITRKPGDLTMTYNIRGRAGASSGRGVTTDKLLTEAAKFRILNGIREHVASRVGDVASFDLAFDLACRELPDIINPEEILAGNPAVGL